MQPHSHLCKVQINALHSIAAASTSHSRCRSSGTLSPSVEHLKKRDLRALTELGTSNCFLRRPQLLFQSRSRNLPTWREFSAGGRGRLSSFDTQRIDQQLLPTPYPASRLKPQIGKAVRDSILMHELNEELPPFSNCLILGSTHKLVERETYLLYIVKVKRDN